MNEVQALLPERSRLVLAAAICRVFCFPFAADATISLARVLHLCLLALALLRLAFRFLGRASIS